MTAPGPKWRWHSAALITIALAFYLRLHYLGLFFYHIDEFFTLAAARLIADTGLPRYPTGLFYDPGLPFSYIDGALFRLLGFSEALGRWPAVIFGTLAVAVVYWLGARLLRSPGAGVLAALGLALGVDSVEWGGRARMISLAQWLVLLAVALLWLGLTVPSARRRVLFAASYGLALLSHLSTVVLMPAWWVAAAALWTVKAVRFERSLLRDGLLLLTVFGLVLSSGAVFQPPPSLEFQASDGGLVGKIAVLLNKFLRLPSDVGHAWEVYGSYFLTLPHGPVLALALLGLVFSLARLAGGRRQRRDLGALYLGAIFLTTLLALTFVINPHWQRARYLLMQAQGLFLLLGAHGWRELAARLPRPVRHRSIWSAGLATALALALLIPFVPPLQASLKVGSTGWNRYDLAFKHVRDNLAAGDQVMTMHPPASLLYLNRDDYYLVQSSAKLIVRPDGAPGDRYTGARWLKTVDEFNQTLAAAGRVWLVTQEFWLFNSYDGYLQQQILWQMDKLWGEGGVWALASRPGAWPLAREAEVILNAEFEDGTRLLGFTANPPATTPGGFVQLTLFWQGQAIPYGAKVFVHVRDADNNTVAQADHFIYDGKVPSSRWHSLLANDTALRDGATILLPADIAPGAYRVLAGFYHPETFERLGVVNDRSGESGVILGELIVN
ncbi:MAG: hypothetical protein ACE5H9_10310 [Anaerolineae bacterium]